MKALLVIFAIFINYVICENNKYAVKSFPKKVRPYGNGKILINSGKYLYKTKPSKSTTKDPKRSYTVFQVVGHSQAVEGVPDSPYFPVDQSIDQKPRVKKVLPDYAWVSLRSKRSAVLEPPADEKKVEITTTENILTTKVEKIIETTPEVKPEKKIEEVKVERKSAPLLKKKGEIIKNSDEDKSTTKDDPKEKVTIETTTDKPIERSGTEKTTSTEKKDISRAGKSDLKPAKVAINKKLESKLDDKDKESSKILLKPDKNKSTNGSSTNIKDKAKNKRTSAQVINVRSNNKKNASTLPKVQNRAGKRKQSTKPKSRKGKAKSKTSKKGPKAHKKSQQRTKNQGRPKKGQKIKRTNGTRTGRKPKAERRLIAAREALIEDYPYVVSIQKDDQHWCSGALLNQRLVITTANCLWKATRVSRMEVRTGSRHVDHGGQLAGIQEIMKHPAWGLRKSPDHDVALILLDRNIKFSDSVHAVDLPNRVMMPPFDDAWVTSWGAERRDGVYDTDSSTLQVYHTRLVDRSKCNNFTIRFSVVVTENFICLAQTGRAAPCTRDTGAPAVSDGILWGLASWGIRKLCGTERFPAMFSYTASHANLDFITNATRFLMSDKRFYPFGDRFPIGAVTVGDK